MHQSVALKKKPSVCYPDSDNKNTLDALYQQFYPSVSSSPASLINLQKSFLPENEDILNIIFHETFHAIEAYLRAFNVTFSRWNSLNPSGFTYTNVYYTNMTFSDVYGYNNNANEIYFVDNYARSSEMEDRARTFEQVGLGTNLTNYPHLNAKVNYLKQVLLTNFPELKNSRYFV